MSVCYALAPFSVLIGSNGNPARSLELYAVVCQSPLVAKSRWFEDVYGRQLSVIAEGLPTELVQSARERGTKRDLWETAAEVLKEFECKTTN
jgi:hypothetical protein